MPHLKDLDDYVRAYISSHSFDRIYSSSPLFSRLSGAQGVTSSTANRMPGPPIFCSTMPLAAAPPVDIPKTLKPEPLELSQRRKIVFKDV